MSVSDRSRGGGGHGAAAAVEPVFREAETGAIISREAGMTPGHGAKISLSGFVTASVAGWEFC